MKNNNTEMDRFEKLEYLQETCSKDFLDNHFLNELVNWMGEDDFTEFYDRLCRLWDIKTPEELNKAMGIDDEEQEAADEYLIKSVDKS
jgi:hypothetical protein